jgi:hypothetical protein
VKKHVAGSNPARDATKSPIANSDSTYHQAFTIFTPLRFNASLW